MSRVLSVYLAATILVCPLFCHVAQCSVTAEGVESVRGCCCGNGAGSPLEEQPTAPERRSSDSGGCCQCICGGAVVDAAAADIAGVDTGWWSPVVILMPGVSFQKAQFDWSCAALWSDDDMNTGRAVCCLYCTLLC